MGLCPMVSQTLRGKDHFLEFLNVMLMHRYFRLELLNYDHIITDLDCLSIIQGLQSGELDLSYLGLVIRIVGFNAFFC